MKPLALIAFLSVVAPLGGAVAQSPVLTGQAAFGDHSTDAPGVRRLIRPADMPAPFTTPSARNPSRLAARPEGSVPAGPPGFSVTAFASGLEGPRRMRVAPNGDVFVAESAVGRISVIRAGRGEGGAQVVAFAEGLRQPYGIAFWPQRNPRWIYIGNTDRVIRYPYTAGDLMPRGPAEVVIPALPAGGGHWTRDLAFSPDGSTLFVAVGSASNVAETMPKMTPDEIEAWEARHGRGAGWAGETNRAVVLSADPTGRNLKIFATGIRNCSGLSMNRRTGDLWCSTNERDGMGDDLAPDYSTRVKAGQFFGWPWYYLGPNEDPRHAGARPDLKALVATPDVLYQAHSAPLQLEFYEGSGPAAFPRRYAGDAFVALHGSWNRARRTGYKVVRLRLNDGVPTGEYEDFLVGFVAPGGEVWGRPVGVAVAADGALLVSDDAADVIWRVARN